MTVKLGESIRKSATYTRTPLQTASHLTDVRPDVADETSCRMRLVIEQPNHQPSAFVRSLIRRRRFALRVVTTGLRYVGPSRTVDGIARQAELRRKAEAVALVDATFLAATRQGQTLAQVFSRATSAYKGPSFPSEWHLHHQGGLAGSEPREFVSTPSSEDLVHAGQVYSWDPSITRTKSEDSILVGDTLPEVVGATDGRPELPVALEGVQYTRPANLEVA